jgi:hypothetical protein
MPYIDELIRIAGDTRCTVLLDLEQVSILDQATVRYLAEGEGKQLDTVAARGPSGSGSSGNRKSPPWPPSFPNIRQQRGPEWSDSEYVFVMH